LNWEIGLTDRAITYCDGIWNCTSKTGDYCNLWNCTSWAEANLDSDIYCTGVTECVEYLDGECVKYNCTEWTNTAATKADRHCIGTYDCISWNDNACEEWDCTTWSSTETAQKDYYPLAWGCSEWRNDIYCDKWKPLSWTAGAVVEKDYYCKGGWDCTTWNTTTAQCINWTCQGYAEAPAADIEYYCSGTFNCTKETIIDVTDPNATLISPPNGTLTNNVTINFTANFTDDYELENATLYIYNSTGLYNETSQIAPGGLTQWLLGIPVTMIEGNYSWSYIVRDTFNNQNETINWTLSIDLTPPVVNIVSPVNDSTFNLCYLEAIITTDETQDTCWYSTDGGTTNITMNEYNSITQGKNFKFNKWLEFV